MCFQHFVFLKHSIVYIQNHGHASYNYLGVGPTGTNVSVIGFQLRKSSLRKMHLKVSSVKNNRPFRAGLNVFKQLTIPVSVIHIGPVIHNTVHKPDLHGRLLSLSFSLLLSHNHHFYQYIVIYFLLLLSLSLL